MSVRGTDISSNKTRRMCFNINGLLGGIIATLLLLSILAFLTIQAIGVQQANATKFYELKDQSSIKMRSTDNAAHWVDKE
jgi:hypothetical protein